MYAHIRTQFLRYMGHVVRNIGGYQITFQPKGSSQDIYVPQPLDKQKAALNFVSEQVLTEPVWLRDLSYAHRLWANPQAITNSIGESVVTNLMSRLDALNDLYKPQAYLADLTKMIFTELDTNRKVSPYRIALQNNMYLHLSQAYGNGNQKVRPAVLYILQQLERKTKAASQSAPDAESRAHWANLYDQIGRLLSWK